MKKRSLRLFVGLVLAASASFLVAGDVDDYSAFQEARKLEHEGNDKEAFLKFLAVPGGEFAAASLARGNAQEFLALLRQNPRRLESPRAALVEADLLLASAQTEQAKQRYHQLAATAPAENWGAAQPGYYPVEPPKQLGLDNGFESFARGQLSLPFSYGPGSHRDNWLLRRLIALDLTEDAAREFARLWRCIAPTRSLTWCWRRVTTRKLRRSAKKEAGPPPWFQQLWPPVRSRLRLLSQTRRPDQQRPRAFAGAAARDGHESESESHPAGANARVNARSASEKRARVQSLRLRPRHTGVSRKEFIRLTHGEFKSAGREPALVAELAAAD